MRKNGGRSGDRRSRIDFQLEAKEKQASKLAEIREALVAAGYDTTAKQAAILGVCRSTAWVLLNRDKRAGPSAKVIKRILSSPNIPKRVRLKVEQYVKEKIRGLYGHSKQRTQLFGDQFKPTKAKARRGRRSVPFGTVAVVDLGFRVVRTSQSKIHEGLKNLTSELHELQKFMKTEVARVQSEVDSAMAGIKIIMEAIAPLRRLRSGPAANISAPLHQAPPLTPSAESVEFEPGAADHQIPLEIHKLGLSDNQLEIIMRTAKPMAEEKCQEFLQRVAAILPLRGQINDNDVSVAVHRALGEMIRNLPVGKEWN